MGDFHQRGWGEPDPFAGPTIPPRFPPDCPVPVRLNLSLAEANARARREFWRGAVFGGLMVGAASIASLAVIAGAAFGLTISGSTVTLEPSADPAAIADVVFVNDLSNDGSDTGDYILSQDGLQIGVAFVWNANFIGADQIIVTPPVGMTCRPVNCSVTVIEGTTGRVTLLPYQGA